MQLIPNTPFRAKARRPLENKFRRGTFTHTAGQIVKMIRERPVAVDMAANRDFLIEEEVSPGVWTTFTPHADEILGSRA